MRCDAEEKDVVAPPGVDPDMVVVASEGEGSLRQRRDSIGNSLDYPAFDEFALELAKSYDYHDYIFRHRRQIEPNQGNDDDPIDEVDPVHVEEVEQVTPAKQGIELEPTVTEANHKHHVCLHRLVSEHHPHNGLPDEDYEDNEEESSS